jgi:hypothetical protein
MDDPKKHVIDSLKQANNILVTVKNSPTVDQLSACIALTLIVNELGKHGTAVFSGEVPSILDFLEPEKTIEKNTDSLQDFIISLDKAKADKLRYKVEDKVVKIFITPYRVSLSDKDLEFGQGDFNVDVVVALGVHSQDDLDQAITSHGRILHDATVISINTEGGADQDLGSINWVDGSVSSLSELVATFADKLGKDKVVDNQVATALLTGIVAETERFGNAKTKPATMEVAARLLTAGANQELVASELAKPVRPISPVTDNFSDMSALPGLTDMPSATEPKQEEKGGELDIEHSADERPVADASPTTPFVPSMPQPSFDLPPLPAPENDGIGQLTSGFAKENADFEIPQEPAMPSDNGDKDNSPPNDKPDNPGGGQIPPILGPDTPSFPQPPLPTPSSPSEQAGNDQKNGEEQAALDFLKEHKFEYAARQKLEPISRRSDILERTPPQLGPAVATPDGSRPGQPDDSLANSHLALTPPTMGGTLTANLPSDGEDRGTMDALVSQPAPAAPILTHERLKVTVPSSNTAPASIHTAVPPSEAPKRMVVPVTPAAPVPSVPPAPKPAPTAPVAAPAPAPAPITPAPAPKPVAAPQPKPAAVPPAPVVPVSVQAPLATPKAAITATPALRPASESAPEASLLPPEPPKPAAPVTTTPVPTDTSKPSGPAPAMQAEPLKAADVPAAASQPSAQPDVPKPVPGPAPAIQAAPLELGSQSADPINLSQPTASVSPSTASSAEHPPLEAAMQDASRPPAGAMDMPKPPQPTIKLPSPQTASATGAATVSPLAPPPPVPPPLPGA